MDINTADEQARADLAMATAAEWQRYYLDLERTRALEAARDQNQRQAEESSLESPIGTIFTSYEGIPTHDPVRERRNRETTVTVTEVEDSDGNNQEGGRSELANHPTSRGRRLPNAFAKWTKNPNHKPKTPNAHPKTLGPHSSRISKKPSNHLSLNHTNTNTHLPPPTISDIYDQSNPSKAATRRHLTASDYAYLRCQHRHRSTRNRDRIHQKKMDALSKTQAELRREEEEEMKGVIGEGEEREIDMQIDRELEEEEREAGWRW